MSEKYDEIFTDFDDEDLEPIDPDLEDIMPEEYDLPKNSSASKKSAPKPSQKNSSHKNNSSHKKKSSSKKRKKKKKKQSSDNLLHILFLSLIALILLVIIVKIVIWNKGTKEADVPASTENFDTEAMDSIVPLDSSDTSVKEIDEDLHILFLGNGQLAEDKDSPDNLANVIAHKTGATVYNCAIADSYMSMKNDTYKGKYPYDAFSFYNICVRYALDFHQTFDWATNDLGGSLPADVVEAEKTFDSIDKSELDVICIYYDSSDYQEKRVPYDDDNESNPSTYAGALKAGLDLLRDTFPDTRIIVLSPTYSYYVKDDGSYISCFDEKINPTPLYIYVIHEQDTCYKNNVSFVDNFYGTIYEELAEDYLTDNKRLNQAGTELVADRFAYALNFFNEYQFPEN